MLESFVRKLEGDQEPENTYNLPRGRKVSRELKKWFEKQKAEVLGTLPTLGTEIPTHFPALTNYDDPMAAAMTPLIGTYWDEAGKQTRERLGLDPDEWKVTNPHVKSKIEGQCMAFCKSTNDTTSKALSTALDKLRSELAAGIVTHGETLDQLTARVQGVFDQAEEWRARRIAATETSRAVHAAQETAALDTGVVAGFEWLVSGDACPLCQMVATEANMVKAGQDFAVVGDNPHYKNIRHPPLHPHCQCAMIEVLTPEYGGPANPEWAQTLDQPKPGPEYSPPPGKKLAKPDAKALDKFVKPIEPRKGEELVTVVQGSESKGEPIPHRETPPPVAIVPSEVKELLKPKAPAKAKKSKKTPAPSVPKAQPIGDDVPVVQHASQGPAGELIPPRS